ncbi:hypothetical protein CcaverHIS002_0510170 [Cutaneotrichosporon cavernicola]|nr:hypothetical protein CcaverHIS002_0510170 [Cutaneotrichosporon cavernicola]
MSSERTPLIYPEGPSPARRRLLVAATMLTSFLAMLDLTIVATCVPTIAFEFGAFDCESWIGTSYLWSNVTFTPLYARLSDAIGRRTAQLQAASLFNLGTLACGLAPSFTGLTVARFLAGIGGGGASTIASIVLSESLPPQDRGFYQGLGFAVFVAGMGSAAPSADGSPRPGDSGLHSTPKFPSQSLVSMVFEIVFDESLSRAGAHILPNSAAMTLSAPIMGYLVKRTRRYKWLTVTCCAGAGRRHGPPLGMGTGVGSGGAMARSRAYMGAGFSSLLTLTLKSQIAVATGFVFVFRSLGQVFGVGVSGAAFQASIAAELRKRFSDPKVPHSRLWLTPQLIDALRSVSKTINRFPAPGGALAVAAYGAALRNTFLFDLAGAVAVFVASLFIPDLEIIDDGGKVAEGAVAGD